MQSDFKNNIYNISKSNNLSNITSNQFNITNKSSLPE